MPLIETKGAASAQGFGEFAASSGPVTYIEDVFSTYLYTGNGSSQTITNGIDLSTKGGMVITKARSIAYGNILVDTTRGVGNILQTSTTNAQIAESTAVTGVSTTGFSVGSYSNTNGNGQTFASWTFRKQPKFFDVVTYTGNGTTQTISHNLGSAPGMIIVKNLTSASGYVWLCYHQSLGAGSRIVLNSTSAAVTSSAETFWGNNTTTVTPTSSAFVVGNNGNVNFNGDTYVAYLFAHNAGGFGLTGTDNVISCGSFTTDGSGNSTVTLGYEPQWVVIKNTTSPENWFLNDIMRGMPAPPSGSGTNVNLFPNTSAAESIQGYDTSPTATGFAARTGNPSQTYIYIAIRRGPMKVPTSGTSVFSAVAYTGDGNVGRTVSTTITPDLSMTKGRSNSYVPFWNTRLQGKGLLYSSATTEERQPTGFTNGAFSINTNSQAQIVIEGGSGGAVLNSNESGATYINWNFRRAPGFFDEVCYTGTGSLRTVSHNLGAVPELLIVKRRDTAEDWNVYSATTGNAAYLRLNTTAAVGTAGADALWGSTTPTSSVFTVKTSGGTNASGGTFVAYLFATCAGVSKVGSFSYATGSSTNVDCGFTSGARFVLIKQTDGVDAWYVFDTARGIVAGNDPFLELNSSAAENSSFDVIDPYSAGFTIPAGALGTGTFIFLAIA